MIFMKCNFTKKLSFDNLYAPKTKKKRNYILMIFHETQFYMRKLQNLYMTKSDKKEIFYKSHFF